MKNNLQMDETKNQTANCNRNWLSKPSFSDLIYNYNKKIKFFLFWGVRNNFICIRDID